MQNMDRFHKAWFGRCIKFMKSRKMLITSASHKRGETVRTGGDAGNEAFSIAGGKLLVRIAAGAVNLSEWASEGRSVATHKQRAAYQVIKPLKAGMFTNERSASPDNNASFGLRIESRKRVKV